MRSKKFLCAICCEGWKSIVSISFCAENYFLFENLSWFVLRFLEKNVCLLFFKEIVFCMFCFFYFINKNMFEQNNRSFSVWFLNMRQSHIGNPYCLKLGTPFLIRQISYFWLKFIPELRYKFDEFLFFPDETRLNSLQENVNYSRKKLKLKKAWFFYKRCLIIGIFTLPIL